MAAYKLSSSHPHTPPDSPTTPALPRPSSSSSSSDFSASSSLDTSNPSTNQSRLQIHAAPNLASELAAAVADDEDRDDGEEEDEEEEDYPPWITAALLRYTDGDMRAVERLLATFADEPATREVWQCAFYFMELARMRNPSLNADTIDTVDTETPAIPTSDLPATHTPEPPTRDDDPLGNIWATLLYFLLALMAIFLAAATVVGVWGVGMDGLADVVAQVGTWARGLEVRKWGVEEVRAAWEWGAVKPWVKKFADLNGEAGYRAGARAAGWGRDEL
ncbi:hypothetical protein EDC01DRAFT_775391 [Geopyxis carbonaria]|nr:hypothetical protein EDC01DRAFT_775391 [Geopyxis carbonaria]